MLKVGFQGLRGAYSEMALKKYFGDKAEPFGFNEFEDVFKALENDRIDYGVLPLENTMAGTVTENYDMLLRYDVNMTGEVYLKIEHCLLGLKGAAFKDVAEAYSHPHALKQCRAFCKEHNITPIPKFDTAGSSAWVAEQGDRRKAGIASILCAKIYDMEVLAENIQSNDLNTTRFAVARKGTADYDKIEFKNKTSLAFKARHEPGTLLQCLKIFAEYNLNLTKLESRPIPESPWEYIFYTDFEANEDTAKGSTKAAIARLKEQVLMVKLLGTYNKAV